MKKIKVIIFLIVMAIIAYYTPVYSQIPWAKKIVYVAPVGPVPMLSYSTIYSVNAPNANADYQRNATDANGGYFIPTFTILSGETGYITQKVILPLNTGANEFSTALMFAGNGTLGMNNYLASNAFMRCTDSGFVIYGTTGDNQFTNSGYSITSPAIMKIEIDATNIYCKVSINAGASYTTLKTASRPSGTITFYIDISDVKYNAYEMRQYK